MDKMSDIKLVKQLTKTRDQFNVEISKRILGQQEVIDHILIALLCKGHTLLVGVPGLAKTLLIKSIAEFRLIPEYLTNISDEGKNWLARAIVNILIVDI